MTAPESIDAPAPDDAGGGGEALAEAGRWVYGAGYRDGYVDGRTIDTEWPADDGFDLVKQIDSTAENDGWGSAEDTFNGMVKAALASRSPILGAAGIAVELTQRLEWATDALRVLCGITDNEAQAMAKAGLDLCTADEEALLGAGNDEALRSLAAARQAPAAGSAEPVAWALVAGDGELTITSTDEAAVRRDAPPDPTSWRVVPLYTAPQPGGAALLPSEPQQPGVVLPPDGARNTDGEPGVGRAAPHLPQQATEAK